MTGMEVSYAGALLAGMLSFLSPCVLPLVPPYLCFLAGTSLAELTGQETEGRVSPAVKRRVRLAALAFVLGFATVFVLMGATASAVGQLLSQYLDLLAKVAGVVIIVLGLHFLGVFRIGLLFRQARFEGPAKPMGLIGAYVVGLAFAFGWTPCVGPVLASILFLAAGEDSLLSGTSLLGVYAAGIGLPFLAAAFAIGPFLAFMKRFRGHLDKVEKGMGALLVITGVLFLTGAIPEVAYWMQETFPALSRIG